MAAKSDETERGAERLIFFTDAVVAIAITLLILPLVDLVTADAAKVHPVPIGTFLSNNFGQLAAFGLSFVIIARFWIANHEIMVDVVRTSLALMWLDIAWVFTIVLLPLPTEISGVFPASVFTVVIYIGTALASTLMLTALSVYLYRNPQLERTGKHTSLVQVWGISSTAAAFLLALALAVIFPGIHYYSLLALLLAVPIDSIIKPRIRRRETASRK